MQHPWIQLPDLKAYKSGYRLTVKEEQNARYSCMKELPANFLAYDCIFYIYIYISLARRSN